MFCSTSLILFEIENFIKDIAFVKLLLFLIVSTLSEKFLRDSRFFEFHTHTQKAVCVEEKISDKIFENLRKNLCLYVVSRYFFFQISRNHIIFEIENPLKDEEFLIQSRIFEDYGDMSKL